MALCSDFTTSEKVYVGYDNPVSIIPYSDYTDRVNWDMSNTTKVIVSADLTTSTVSGDAIVVDSAVSPTMVKFSQDAGSIWQIHMIIGMFPAIVSGAYTVRVIIYDPDNPNGVVIGDDLLVTVVGTH